MAVDSKDIDKTTSPLFFFVDETGKMVQIVLDTLNWKFYSFQIQRLYSCQNAFHVRQKHVKFSATEQIDTIVLFSLVSDE